MMAKAPDDLTGSVDAKDEEAATEANRMEERGKLRSAGRLVLKIVACFPVAMVLWKLICRVNKRTAIASKGDEDLASQYLDIAIQYYIAGRSAYFAWSFPVAGNLLHHGIEMLLKFFLIKKGYPASELQFGFGHKLWKLWTEYKKVSGNSALKAYDGIINEIDPIDDIRYPKKRGYTFRMDLRKGPRPVATGPLMKGVRQYHVTLEEVDELMSALLTSNVNPEWVKGLLSRGDAMSQYTRDNFHKFI